MTPVLDPVAPIVTPILKPVAPVVTPVAPIVAPVVDSVAPIAPVVTPVVPVVPIAPVLDSLVLPAPVASVVAPAVDPVASLLTTPVLVSLADAAPLTLAAPVAQLTQDATVQTAAVVPAVISGVKLASSAAAEVIRPATPYDALLPFAPAPALPAGGTGATVSSSFGGNGHDSQPVALAALVAALILAAMRVRDHLVLRIPSSLAQFVPVPPA